MERCACVEREVDKVLQKFLCYGQHCERGLEELLRYVSQLREELGAAALQRGPLSATLSLVMSQCCKKIKDTVQNLASDHKDIHSSISRVGKAIDRGSRGELLLSLCYNPSANSITVNIIKARNLKAMDIGGTSDPYVKVWLMYKDKRVEKKKTVVMKRCLNPVFNESFMFDIPTEKLRETTIIITVMDKDKLSRNDVIGKIYLSWKSGPGEVKHWKDMISHPRQAVAQWHQLKA